MSMTIQKKILVVDDEIGVRKSVELILNNKFNEYGGYSVITCDNAIDAMSLINDNNIEVIISDIKMPKISGMELLSQIRKSNKQVPVLLMTAYADLDSSVEAIRNGAFDFIMKPLNPDYLIHTVKKALELSNLRKFKDHYKNYLEQKLAKQTGEFEKASNDAEQYSKELITRLTKIAEFRDTEGGEHISRIAVYSVLLAGAMDMPLEFTQLLKHASPLHDIGKIRIPDGILFKSGHLSPQEFEVMKTHTTEGARVLARSTHPIMRMAESIALTHHERWNGTGYPRKLSGLEIPIEGRIVIMADQYDAIRSERIYKPGLSHEETVKIITQGDGRTMPDHFDPKVLDAFMQKASIFDDVFQSYRDITDVISL